ncbi:hypothetical protein [Serratia quinivorans]|uniref:hypothetical protein n=1 Tax=Serratia quinivorans TaxID=137545 RepID=UPI0039826F45
MDKLEVTFCHQAGEYTPFICAVNGRATTNELCEIEAEVAESEYDDLKQTGLYTFSCTYYLGQYGEYGVCEIAPGWELNLIKFTPPEVNHG